MLYRITFNGFITLISLEMLVVDTLSVKYNNFSDTSGWNQQLIRLNTLLDSSI